jgi:hypothetical protein
MASGINSVIASAHAYNGFILNRLLSINPFSILKRSIMLVPPEVLSPGRYRQRETIKVERLQFFWLWQLMVLTLLHTSRCSVCAELLGRREHWLLCLC